MLTGSYEVMFYDGFKKTVQPINVKYMPPEVQVEVSTSFSILGPGTSFNIYIL